MRVVFMGTPAFAVPSLEALVARHDVALVLTRPDRAAGRGSGLRPSEVKQAAERLGIEVLQPTTLRGEAARTIAGLRPDVACVAAFGMLLPPEVLEIPRYGCINVHASVLPRYRGAAPIQRAILHGEDATGVSIMRMEEGLDTGPFAAQRSVPVGLRYAAEVEEDLALEGAAALLEVLAAIEAGSVSWTEQDGALATYAAKITKDDVALTPEITVAEAYARVRAATRRAPARACLGDLELTVVRAHPCEAEVAPGGVCNVDGVPSLGLSDGALALDVVRPAGKGDMAGPDWARGARLSADACWRCTR